LANFAKELIKIKNKIHEVKEFHELFENVNIFIKRNYPNLFVLAN